MATNCSECNGVIIQKGNRRPKLTCSIECARIRKNKHALKPERKFVENKRNEQLRNDKLCQNCLKKLDPTSNNNTYCLECRNKQSKRSADRRKQRKEIVFNKYGYKCSCCDEKNPKFLTVDHVNNDGNILRNERGKGVDIYKIIIEEGFPDSYQVLCFNCNCGRHLNGGICPHKC